MSYTSDNIKTLDGIAAVRKRPGMYVGSTSSENGHNPRGLIQLFQEIMSNATDEAMAGFGQEIDLVIGADNSITISDCGRGLPMGTDYQAAIDSFTKLHTSGKFDESAYAESGGQHGIGSKATNALSKWLSIDAIDSEHNQYHLKFEQEKVLEKNHKKVPKSTPTGTTIHFLPDTDIFDSIDWDLKTLQKRVNRQAYLVPGVKYHLVDQRIDESFDYLHENGMADLVNFYADGISRIGMKEPLRIIDSRPFEAGAKSEISVEVALLYTESIGDNIVSFANGIPTTEDGPHVDGAKSAIVKVFNDYAKDKKLLNGKQTLTANDTRDGLVLAIAVGIPTDSLQFESQTKEKLGTAQARPVVNDILYTHLSRYLYDHVTEANAIVAKMLDAKDARETTAKIRQDKKAARSSKSKDKFALSDKLTPARSKDPQVKELLVVEGDSAGGSAKGARNSLTQAVLPLRGKPLNVSGLRLSRILANEELNTLVKVIGGGVGKEFNVDDIQYDKLIIMTDADDDGYHIFELLVQAIWTLMPDFIRQGHLYVANAPLFRFDRYVKGKRQKDFALTIEDFEAMKQTHKGWNVTRMKGLGEMDPDDLKVTTVQPGTRTLTRIKVSDGHELTQMLDLFVGSGSNAAEKRRDWITDNVDFNSED